jgi:hypothetical protein
LVPALRSPLHPLLPLHELSPIPHPM